MGWSGQDRHILNTLRFHDSNLTQFVGIQVSKTVLELKPYAVTAKWWIVLHLLLIFKQCYEKRKKKKRKEKHPTLCCCKTQCKNIQGREGNLILKEVISVTHPKTHRHSKHQASFQVGRAGLLAGTGRTRNASNVPSMGPRRGRSCAHCSRAGVWVHLLCSWEATRGSVLSSFCHITPLSMLKFTHWPTAESLIALRQIVIFLSSPNCFVVRPLFYAVLCAAWMSQRSYKQIFGDLDYLLYGCNWLLCL